MSDVRVPDERIAEFVELVEQMRRAQIMVASRLASGKHPTRELLDNRSRLQRKVDKIIRGDWQLQRLGFDRED